MGFKIVEYIQHYMALLRLNGGGVISDYTLVSL
jgi:hypothetical protein